MSLGLETASDAAPAKLVAAVRAAWMARGCGELSARGIAAAAGLNASAIYYHFDDLEHLYEAAQHAALDDAGRWIAARRNVLEDVGAEFAMGPAAMAALLDSWIDDWCESARPLAFAWRECQLLAARVPRFAPVLVRWQSLWAALWRDVCARFGAADAAQLTGFYFDSEALLHMMRWNRDIDRAALAESAATWAGWIEGRCPGAMPWRDVARSRARERLRIAEVPSGNSLRVARAAAQVLAENGAGAVTHRAVAAVSGLTLGVVSHNARRTEDLLSLAYSAIYLSLTGALPHDQRSAAPPPGGDAPGKGEMLAIDELILAVARGRADPSLAGLLRFLRGSTSVFTVQERVACSEPQSRALAVVYSSIALGYWRARRGDDAGDSDDYERFNAQLFGLLKRQPSAAEGSG